MQLELLNVHHAMIRSELLYLTKTGVHRANVWNVFCQSKWVDEMNVIHVIAKRLQLRTIQIDRCINWNKNKHLLQKLIDINETNHSFFLLFTEVEPDSLEKLKLMEQKHSNLNSSVCIHENGNQRHLWFVIQNHVSCIDLLQNWTECAGISYIMSNIREHSKTNENIQRCGICYLKKICCGL